MGIRDAPTSSEDLQSEIEQRRASAPMAFDRRVTILGVLAVAVQRSRSIVPRSASRDS